MSVSRIDRIESNAATAGALATANGITTLVDPTIAMISVPSTTIVGQAQIPDITQDCAVSFGINRIPVQTIYQLQNEFGPNGESVFGVAGDTLGLIRFVGSGWTSGAVADGQPISTAISGDYCEITFFGTNLNMLCDLGYSSLNMLPSVDGGSNGANIFAAAYSGVLDGRNYSSNQVLNVITSQSLGIHTVKLTNNSTNAVKIHGFEILNTSSTTALSINKGKVFGNQSALTLAANATSAYNSGFETGSLGTKGGHVLTYLKSDGTIGKAVTPTDTTALYMTSASHINEEVVRKYHFREFGAGRAGNDDFSQQVGSSLNKAFTLDDGTTTLVGSTININAPGSSGITKECMGPTTTSSFITFTFIGTGIDLNIVGTIGIYDAHSMFIDGVSITTTLVGTANNYTLKVASGLPYGTHTIKILRTATGNYGICFDSFIVYQPKKPTLPSGAIELADYNVMASYVANATAGLETIATGILRKHPTREITFSGSSWSTSISTLAQPGGWDGAAYNQVGAYWEYTFFGTGFEIRGQTAGRITSSNFLIDGNTLSTTGFSINHNGGGASGTPTYGTVVTSTYGGFAFTSSTGVLNLNAADQKGAGFTLNGLPLGKHTIRLTSNVAATQYMDAHTFDIITPIHSAKSNSIYDAQNTLPVGSCAISDSRKFGASAVQTKAWAQAMGVISAPTMTGSTFLPVPDMSLTLKTSGSPIEASYSITSINSAVPNVNEFQMFVDGIAVGTIKQCSIMANAGYSQSVTDSVIIPVSQGVHKIDLYARTPTGGTVTFASNDRNIKVREI